MTYNNRPLISLCLAALIGIFIFYILDFSYVCAVLFAALFFLFIFILNGRYMMFICMAMMIVSFINTYNYYNLGAENKCFNVTITDTSYNDIYGEINGRKVLVINNKIKLLRGYEYKVNGIYKSSIDIEKGISGIVCVNNIISCRETYRSKIIKLNHNIYMKMKDIIGEKSSAIVCSAAFGNREYISQDQKQMLNEYGISHIISVSGFHISLVYLILSKMCGFYISTIGTLIYVIFTGASSSALRSFFMFFILMLSKKIMKNYDAVSSLCLSALILILYKPYYVYNIGFILSYAATLSIILFYKKIRYKLYKIPALLRDSVSLTISAEVFTFPIAALYFKEVSLNFILGNVFIVPIFSGIIVLADIAALFISIPFMFSKICMIIKLLLLSVEGAIFILNKISLPMMNVNVAMVNVYCFMMIFMYFYIKGFKKAKYSIIPLSIYYFLYTYTFVPRITFIKNKFNKCVYIESGFSKLLLMKKSKYNNFSDIEYNELVYLKNGGTIKINDKIFYYDKSLENMYIKYNNKKVKIKWSNKEEINTYDYGIININSSGESIILGNEIKKDHS